MRSRGSEKWRNESKGIKGGEKKWANGGGDDK